MLPVLTHLNNGTLCVSFSFDLIILFKAAHEWLERPTTHLQTTLYPSSSPGVNFFIFFLSSSSEMRMSHASLTKFSRCYCPDDAILHSTVENVLQYMALMNSEY